MFQKIRNIIRVDTMIVGLIAFVAFLFRFKGLLDSHPFWVDEFSTAHQASLLSKYGLELFSQQNYYVEVNKLVPTALVAFFFDVLGREEWVARLPFVIIGSFVPVCAYILGKQVIDRLTGFIAALFCITSYFLITWSRQARGYVVTQLLILLLLYLYIRMTSQKRNNIHVFFFVLITIVGIFTHQLFIIALAAVVFHWLLQNFKTVKSVFNKYIVIAGIAIIGLLAISGIFSQILLTVQDGVLTATNNAWYYHSFLWREYTLITFTGVFGLLFALLRKKKGIGVVLIYFALHFGFILFIFDPYVVRYLLPIAPLLFIGMAYFLTYISRIVVIDNKWQVPALLAGTTALVVAFGIVGSGDTFVKKPLPYYSVNHTFREIALIDYDKVYGLIQEKGSIQAEQTAVIDTWADRLAWYMGEEYEPSYLFRWEDAGPMRRTYVQKDALGNKTVIGRSDMKFIGSVEDLQQVMEQYPSGFIFIDDTSLPADVLEYVTENFTEELYLDHYYLDDNPYSIWPATLYSWGI